MPLIIIVLAVIVACLCARSFNKNSERQNNEYSAAARKTNAKMERNLVDQYMKQGKEFDEAFELARNDMLAAGYEPCIPKNSYNGHSSYCKNCEQYDSVAVRELRQDYKTECQNRGVQWSYEGEDEYIYKSGRLPTSAFRYHQKLSSHWYDAIPVGKYISTPLYGTCEVIDLDYKRSQNIVKILKTGQIVRIPFGDKRITRL